MTDEVVYDFGQDLPAETVATLTTHAKELGLSAEQAPKFAAYYTQQQQAATAANAPPAEYKFPQVDGEDLPAEVVAELSATAKELGLTQAQAEKFAAYELKLRADADKETKAALEKVQQDWRDQVKADKDIGGAKLDENLATAKKALEKFFPEVAKNQAGFPFLDHPDVVRGLVAIGKAIGPDGDFVRSPGSATGAADPAKVLFPNMA